MSQQIINVGSAPNDGTGDLLRNSQIKANANFTELYLTKLESVVAGTNVTVDNTDPLNPIVSAEIIGGGDMLKSVYDTDDDGIVDSAKKEIVQFINKSGATITKGTIVYLKSTSSSSTYPEVIKANATTEATSSKTIGAVYEDVLNDATGFIVTSGEVRNLNTSAYVIGDKLWLSTTDGLVNTTVPTQPNHAVFIGTVTRAQTVNGRVLYAIQNGYELNELHNVLINTPTNDQVLTYESATSLWKNKTASGGVVSVTGDSVDNTDASNPIINAIPLSGTTVGNPVTGDIELDNSLGRRIYGNTSGSYIEFSADGNIAINDESSGNFIASGIILKGNSPSEKGITGTYDYSANITDLDYTQKIYVDSKVGSLIRQQFVFSGSQTFTLSSNYGQVYSVSVQGQGALKDTQYTLVAPNQITILDTLDSDDYIVVLYSSSVTGVQPYYSQAETDGLLALKQNKFFSHKMTTPSSSVTGTTSETELVKVTIPANTFSANDIIRIPTILMTKVGVNNAATVRLKISTSTTMPAGSTSQIAQFTVGGTSLIQNVNRVFYLDGGNLKGWPFTTAANTDISANATAMSTVAFDTTVIQYLYVSGTLLSASDSLRIEGLQIMNN